MVELIEHVVFQEVITHAVVQGLHEPAQSKQTRGDECLECVVLAGPAPHGCGDDHQRLEQALASTRHSPRGLARSGADESFPCAGGPNCPLATNLPRYCGQDRQAISARCAPSQPGTRGAPPINKSRPRPTNQGRGRGFESVRSAEGERHSHSMVAGGLEVTSRTTRLTSGTELVMRVEMRARTS